MRNANKYYTIQVQANEILTRLLDHSLPYYQCCVKDHFSGWSPVEQGLKLFTILKNFKLNMGRRIAGQ